MTKYPRTYHFGWSEGATKDDKVMETFRGLLKQELVVTEKMDGSNIALTNKGIFSRSHSGPPKHDSFNQLKAFWASIAHDIPEDITIWGEWCYAIHSIEYEDLPGPGPFVFAVSKDSKWGRYWFSWDTVRIEAAIFDLPTVPVLADGAIIESESGLMAVSQVDRASCFGGPMEGTVTRTVAGFNEKLFPYRIAKNVRADHVQTDVHWSRNWRKHDFT